MLYIPKSARIFALLRDAFYEFQQNDPLRMAAGTAFFATFALPPILIILIQVFGLFVDPLTLRHDLFEQLSDVLGRNAVLQLRETVRNVRLLSLTWYVKAGVFLFLLFVATTLFAVIKDSLNQLWKIQVKKNPGIAFVLGYRAKSIAVIIMTGFLFLIVLLGEATTSLLRGHTFQLGKEVHFFLANVINQLVSALSVITWFTLIFKFLADGRPTWKVAIGGGVFTGLFFAIGKLLLRWLLSHSNMQTIYGASTSIVLLLLFVFYASFIFYYGACFTKVLANYTKQFILPTRYAVRYTIKRMEWDGNAVHEDS